ncbi:hypothetical protein NQ317_006465, partial [Molorchus minor]
MVPKVEKVIESVTLGEGPHWDAETQALYFVDIVGYSIHKFVPSTGQHTKAKIGKDDQFVISVERQLVLIEWDGESPDVKVLKFLYEVDANTNNVFNDGKTDPFGRLWAGTMGAAPKDESIPDQEGSLFSFQGNKVTTHLTKIANGKPIYTLNKQRGFVQDGVLDGLTIDAEGNLWVAVFNGSRVIKIDPRKPGVVAETISIPTNQVTSVAFAGPNLDELYVTTAKLAVFGDAPTASEAGATFRVTGLNVILIHNIIGQVRQENGSQKSKKVVDVTFELGESPHWDAETQTLYFVDINGHSIHKYARISLGANTTFIIPVAGNNTQFVIGKAREIVLISWNGENETAEVVKTLYEVDSEYPGNVFNDGKCDPSGRLWAGTIGAPPVDLDAIVNGRGSLYSFSNNKATKQISGLGISNGLAFNERLGKFYYIDSRKGTLDEYDIDIANGTICKYHKRYLNERIEMKANGKPVFTLKNHGLEGFLDGMTIDADGNIFAAVPPGYKLIKIDPRRPETLLETIEFPAQEVTAAAFGGPNLDEL